MRAENDAFMHICLQIDSFFAFFGLSVLLSVRFKTKSRIPCPGIFRMRGMVCGLYYGNFSGNYSESINVGANTFVTVPNLVPGKTDFFVVTAYNAAGVQSAPSNQVLLLANFLTGGAGSAIAATPFISYSGDFNGDGKQDILWRNVETGEVDIWYMDG